MSQYLVHRDPRFWPDADQFRPDRFAANGPPNYSYFPFSMGPRKCFGETLALEEATILLWTILRAGVLSLEDRDRKPVCEVILHPDEPVRGTLGYV